MCENFKLTHASVMSNVKYFVSVRFNYFQWGGEENSPIPPSCFFYPKAKKSESIYLAQTKVRFKYTHDEQNTVM